MIELIMKNGEGSCLLEGSTSQIIAELAIANIKAIKGIAKSSDNNPKDILDVLEAALDYELRV